MRLVNYMEENDPALEEEVRCNHGFVVPMKTSWTPRNPDRRYWGPRSCNFYCWEDKESTDPRSKLLISKLIEKKSELEHLVESSPYVKKYISINEDDKLVELEEASEEVNKPKAFNQGDNCIERRLEKLEREIEETEEREKKWKSKKVKQRTRKNAVLFVVFCCCVVTIATNYWFGVIYMKKGSMKLT